MQSASDPSPGQTGFRVLILGLPGSGKTRFACRLADRLGLPRFEADQAFWDENGRERGDFRKRAESALLGQSQWIAEGHYGKLKDLLDPRITHLIWLDYPFSVVLTRWLMRSARTRDFGDLPWLTIKRASLLRGYRSAMERAQARGVQAVCMKTPREAESLFESFADQLNRKESK